MDDAAADDRVPEDEQLPAGSFSAWLDGMLRALRGGRGSDVPCGGCTGCCTSSQFVHIGPDEGETLARIPAKLLFPAPLLPPGHVLLGYDRKGHCPMLIDGECSIYEHRPRTCRTYDCRVFPAAGIGVDDKSQTAIAEQVRRWRFDFPDEVDRVEHDAVRAAARFVRERRGLLPDRTAPANATQHAVLAIELHEAFLGHEDAVPDPEAIRIALAGRAPG